MRCSSVRGMIARLNARCCCALDALDAPGSAPSSSSSSSSSMSSSSSTSSPTALRAAAAELDAVPGATGMCCPMDSSVHAPLTSSRRTSSPTHNAGWLGCSRHNAVPTQSAGSASGRAKARSARSAPSCAADRGAAGWPPCFHSTARKRVASKRAARESRSQARTSVTGSSRRVGGFVNRASSLCRARQPTRRACRSFPTDASAPSPSAPPAAAAERLHRARRARATALIAPSIEASSTGRRNGRSEIQRLSWTWTLTRHGCSSLARDDQISSRELPSLDTALDTCSSSRRSSSSSSSTPLATAPSRARSAYERSSNENRPGFVTESRPGFVTESRPGFVRLLAPFCSSLASMRSSQSSAISMRTRGSMAVYVAQAADAADTAGGAGAPSPPPATPPPATPPPATPPATPPNVFEGGARGAALRRMRS